MMIKRWQKTITGEFLPQLNLLSKADLFLLLFAYTMRSWEPQMSVDF